MSGTVRARAQDAAQRGEVASWALAVVAGGLVFPGLGIVVALVLAATRLKHNSLAVRVGLVSLGLLVLVVQIIVALTFDPVDAAVLVSLLFG